MHVSALEREMDWMVVEMIAVLIVIGDANKHMDPSRTGKTLNWISIGRRSGCGLPLHTPHTNITACGYSSRRMSSKSWFSVFTSVDLVCFLSIYLKTHSITPRMISLKNATCAYQATRMYIKTMCMYITRPRVSILRPRVRIKTICMKINYRELVAVEIIFGKMRHRCLWREWNMYAEYVCIYL